MVNNGCVEPAPPPRPAAPTAPALDEAAAPEETPAPEKATGPGGAAGPERTAGLEGATAGAEAGTSTEVPARLRGGEERRPRDMVLSLAVLLVPIALLVVFYRLVLSGDAPLTVDPGPAIQEARQVAAFTVLEPRGLPGGWHVSTATFKRQADGVTLRIGYVDPGKDPVQLVESSVPTATLLPTELGADAKALGNVRTSAGVWRAYDTRPGEKALVLADGKRTVVVVGKTDVTTLQALAAALA
jgi:hypothetical protein